MLRVPPWSPINQILAVEQFGSPRFLESPLVPLPCSRDPGHAPFALPSQQRGVAPACAKYEGRSDCNFGADSHGFSTRCLRFQLRISLHWQDSLPVGGKPFPGGIRTHWTLLANFKAASSPPIPTPQALPGAIRVELGVAPQSPHRTVRARLAHTVPQDYGFATQSHGRSSDLAVDIGPTTG